MFSNQHGRVLELWLQLLGDFGSEEPDDWRGAIEASRYTGKQELTLNLLEDFLGTYPS